MFLHLKEDFSTWVAPNDHNTVTVGSGQLITYILFVIEGLNNQRHSVFNINWKHGFTYIPFKNFNLHHTVPSKFNGIFSPSRKGCSPTSPREKCHLIRQEDASEKRFWWMETAYEIPTSRYISQSFFKLSCSRSKSSVWNVFREKPYISYVQQVLM